MSTKTHNPTDGTGWLSVRTSTANGIVPATYLEIIHISRERPASTYSSSSTSLSLSNSATNHSSLGGGGSKKKGPAVAPKRGARKLHYVEALYEYGARSDAEWSMSEGERFVLVSKDTGDGWADVEKGGHVKSVPANYLKDV